MPRVPVHRAVTARAVTRRGVRVAPSLGVHVLGVYLLRVYLLGALALGGPSGVAHAEPSAAPAAADEQTADHQSAYEQSAYDQTADERSLLELEHQLAIHYREALELALGDGALIEAGFALHALAGHLAMAERLAPSVGVEPELRARVAQHTRALTRRRVPDALGADVRALERAIERLGRALGSSG